MGRDHERPNTLVACEASGGYERQVVTKLQAAVLSTWSPVRRSASSFLKRFYKRLRANGKPAKVALTAVMRKLLVLLNFALQYPRLPLVS